MTIEFNCPHCSKLLKTPDDKAGVRANCPGCGQTVIVPDLVTEAAQADPSFGANPDVAPTHPQLPDDAQAEGGEIVDPDSVETGSQSDMKPCPMCGAAIRKAATRCRFCGETLARAATNERVPTKIDAGEILSHAWEIYKNQVGLLVGATLVVFGITIVASFAGSMVQNLILLSVAGPAGRGGNPIAMGIGVFGLTLFFTVLNIALNAYLQAGLHVLMLRVARGENADIVDLFAATRFFWRYFWGTLLFQIMVGVGLVFFILPGIFLLLMFWPLYYVIVDRDTGVIESLRLASEITTGNYLAVFVLFLANMGIQLLGMVLLCVGLVFTVPLGELLWATAYCGMNGQLSLKHRQPG